MERIRITMDRISVSLPPVQNTWLQREAKRLGITVSEFLRRLIDQQRLKD